MCLRLQMYINASEYRFASSIDSVDHSSGRTSNCAWMWKHWKGEKAEKESSIYGARRATQLAALLARTIDGSSNLKDWANSNTTPTSAIAELANCLVELLTLRNAAAAPSQTSNVCMENFKWRMHQKAAPLRSLGNVWKYFLVKIESRSKLSRLSLLLQKTKKDDYELIHPVSSACWMLNARGLGAIEFWRKYPLHFINLQASLPVVDNNRKVVGAQSVVGEKFSKNWQNLQIFRDFWTKNLALTVVQFSEKCCILGNSPKIWSKSSNMFI